MVKTAVCFFITVLVCCLFICCCGNVVCLCEAIFFTVNIVVGWVIPIIMAYCSYCKGLGWPQTWLSLSSLFIVVTVRVLVGSELVISIIIAYCSYCMGLCWPQAVLLPLSLLTVVAVRISVGHGLGCYRHHCFLWLV